MAPSQLCPLCGDPCDDQEHIFYKCPSTDHIRKPFVEAIDKVCDWWWYTKDKMTPMVYNNTAFRSCGLVPEDPDPIRHNDARPHTNEFVVPIAAARHLDERAAEG